MTAIFGVLGAASAAELTGMGERLCHRGAVASWDEVAPNIYLGHAAEGRRSAFRRNGISAVIDLSPAPGKANEAEVFDLLIERGLSGLQELGQTFALAAWDERSGTLQLAHDFIGQKPLHYCALPGGGMAFATEYKALLALNALPVAPDLDALQYMQCYKRTPPGKTLLEGVFVLAPGAMARFRPDGTLQSQELMSPVQVNVRSESEDVVREELARRLVQAIGPVVHGQPRVGIALSGGIDSISIAFICRREAPQTELVGFTAGNGPDDPEIRTAAMAMDRLGGRHEPVVVGAESLVELLPEAVWHFENPVGRTEAIQWLQLGRAARRQGFDWLLSGVGGDSLFAGMPKHKLLWLSQLLPPLRKDLHEFYDLTQSGRPPQRPLARLMDAFYFRGAIPPVPRVRGAEYMPDASQLPRPGPEFLNDTLTTNMQDGLSRALVRLERSFQASGVDFVTPYYDRAVMDFAFTIPSRLKIRRGTEKYILRQAMSSVVSRELLDVPKGISRIRQDRAFAEALGQLTDRYLSTDRIRQRGWFDPSEITAIRRSLERKNYHVEAAMRLWTIIVTELWGRIYLDGRGRRPTGAW